MKVILAHQATHTAMLLDCVSGVCKKWLTVAVGGTCACGGDCTPGNVCVNEVCTAQTGKPIGSSCSANSDCQTNVAVCYCNSPSASSGVCIGAEYYDNVTDDYNLNIRAFTTAAVSNCKSLVNQYVNGPIITSSNAAKAFTNYDCVANCIESNGPSTVCKAWQGYNQVYYYAPTTCPNPSSASTISSNVWIGLGMAILFLLM